MEYYILCPQRPDDHPGLITHLISREICDQRQSGNFHKCPNCIRSRMWRERNGYPVDVQSPVEDEEMEEISGEAAVAARRSA